MTLFQASAAWLASQSRYLAPGTLRNYTRIVRALELWAGKRSLADLDKLALQEFFAARQVSQNTAHKETQTVRSIFAFFEEQGYIPVSPARSLKAPRFRPPENAPFTQEEIIRILAAVDTVGQHFYERQRARAAILLMRFHALRISDVVLLRRDAIHITNANQRLAAADGPAAQCNGAGSHDGVPSADSRSESSGSLGLAPRTFRIRLITQKTKTAIDHRAVPEVLEALERLPVPRSVEKVDRCGESEEKGYFFWNGRGSYTSTAANLSATLRSVYRASGVPGAHNHRFRHTRASEILAVGGSMADVGLFLGISARIAERHYCKFMPERQARVDRLMLRLSEDFGGKHEGANAA